ncbi:MAG TPA: MauE/DoxX family redox-associated membrane protein, partial [Blastocatellia bacterium]|nr:MauE/DoxX family redox-associated membrane protein [Blastocatellia bacterium]
MLLLVARLVLALIFVVAGIAKAADLAGSRRAVRSFGIPEGLAAPLGLTLPFVEIVIAVALIPLNSAWVGAIAALAVLVSFVIGIAVNLARGNSPDCHCFGQLHSEPVGWSTLARNIVL